MSVKGKKVLHCRGKKKGKTIKGFGTHKEALEMHRAIMVNEKKKKRKRGKKKDES